MIWWTTAALAGDPTTDPMPKMPLRNPSVPTAPAPAAATPAPQGAAVPVPLYIDAKVPVEVLIEGVKLGELYFPGEVHWDVSAGHHTLRIYTNGDPTDVPVDLVAGSEVHVLVGKTGVSTSTAVVPGAVAGPATVEFRLVGAGTAQIRLDSKPTALIPGQNLSLVVASGNHPLSVRSGDGTVIWATGNLEIDGGPLVVLIAEGRMPEVSGPGSFHASGG